MMELNKKTPASFTSATIEDTGDGAGVNVIPKGQQISFFDLV